MRYFYTLCLICAQVLFLSAQSYVHQIIFLNEGWYDFVNDTLVVPPSVGAYDPVTETYSVFDEIPDADFASDVIVDDVIYVAADNLIVTYDKNTLERLQTVTVPGVRSLAIWEDQLLVSRGDYEVFFESYFQVYNKETFELMYELDTLSGPRFAADGIVIKDAIAYLAINNGFVFGEEVGVIGKIDLVSHTYVGEIDLGPAGINPDNIMLDGDRIYTLNNKNYLSSSISIVPVGSEDVTTIDMIAANAGCGTSAFADDKIYFMEYGVDKLARFDIETHEIIDTLAETGAYYGLIHDEVNQRLVATYTDFFSQGTAYLLSYNGQVMKSFDVGVSPGSIALDVRMVSGVEDAEDSQVAVYPNPASDWLIIESDGLINAVTLTTTTGQVLSKVDVMQSNIRLDLGVYPAGVYFLTVELDSGNTVVKKVMQK